jgi:hypothetical protein
VPLATGEGAEVRGLGEDAPETDGTDDGVTGLGAGPELDAEIGLDAGAAAGTLAAVCIGCGDGGNPAGGVTEAIGRGGVTSGAGTGARFTGVGGASSHTVSVIRRRWSITSRSASNGSITVARSDTTAPQLGHDELFDGMGARHL